MLLNQGVSCYIQFPKAAQTWGPGTLCSRSPGALLGASGHPFQPTLRRTFFWVCPRSIFAGVRSPSSLEFQQPLHLVGGKNNVRGAFGLSSSNFFDLSKPQFPELYNGNINT